MPFAIMDLELKWIHLALKNINEIVPDEPGHDQLGVSDPLKGEE